MSCPLSHWSNHAYGHAIDLNPRENPYVGCGMSRDPTARAYMDRYTADANDIPSLGNATLYTTLACLERLKPPDSLEARKSWEDRRESLPRPSGRSPAVAQMERAEASG